MALLVGIDEAGYGPTLGPLVVASTVWRIPQPDPDIDLWHLLRECVAREASAGQWRIVVGDSKRVFDRKKGLGSLERGVRAFLGAAGFECGDVRRMFDAFGAMITEEWHDAPWYRDLDLALPIDAVAAASEAVCQRLAETLAESGACCVAMRAAVVPEHIYNDRLARTNNKASVLIEQVLRLFDHAARAAGDEDVFVVVDRLGGRDDYRGLLMNAFPDRDLAILRVDEMVSQYRLTPRSRGGSAWQVRFQVEADGACLAVALASMTAKYIRELLMARFNEFWHGLAPDVRPTAGYYTDAQRFLSEIAPAAAAAGIDMQRFTRQK